MGQTLPLAIADYAVFLSLIALFVLSTHALTLRQSGVRDRAWGWASVSFGALGLAHVPELLGVAGVHSPWVDFGWTVLLLLTYAAAVLFSVSDPRQLARRGDVPALIIAALAGVGFAALLGLALEAASVLVGAALLANAYVFLGLRPNGENVAWRIRGASVVLVLLAVAYPASIWAGGADRVEFAMWLLLARTILALLVMFHVGGYVVRESQFKILESERVERIARALLALMFLGALGLGAVVTEYFGRAGETHLLDGLDSSSRMVASALDSEHIREIVDNPGVETLDSYVEIQGSLTDVITRNPSITYAYVMALVDSRPVILVEGVPVDDEPAGAGTLYAEASPELVAALADNLPLREGPLADRWGTWYSAFHPIVDHRTGEPIALLGLDMPSDAIAATRATYRLGGILLALTVSAFVIGLYVVLQMTRSISSNVARSESRFRTVFESAPEAILLIDLETRRVSDFNPQAAQLLGYSREQSDELTIDDIAPGAPALLGNASDLEDQGSISHQCVFETRDDGPIDVEATVVLISHRNRNSAMLFFRDIRERIESEQLRATYSEFNALVTGISGGFVNVSSSDFDALVDAALTRVGEFAGVDRAYVFEFSGDDMTNTFEWCAPGVPHHKQDFDGVPISQYPALTRRILAGVPVHLPDVHQSRDIGIDEKRLLERGGIKSLLCVPMAVAGRTVGLLGFDSIRGVKEWTEADIALLRMVADIVANAQARIRTQDQLIKVSRAVEQSPVAVIITDKDGAIEYVNSAFSEITEYQPEEIMGGNPRILKSEMTPAETHADLWKTVLEGGTWSGEFVNVRKSGGLYPAAARISAVRDSRGAITHLVGVQEDITERKRSEEDLLHATRQAKAANQAKSAFLATMSHEIRTPMNAIIGMAELLRDTELTAQQARYVDIFQRGGETLLELINSVLDLSKIEADRLELEHAPFDLGDVVEVASVVVGAQASSKNLELLYRITPDVPRSVVGDATRLRQVLMNLLGNAVKFTDSGQVLLTVQPDPDRAEQAHLLFSIADTGIGIATDKCEAVFESFTQADSSTTRTHGGTGLGLTISKRIVELMGGRIWVESELGKGSTFFFSVPLQVAEDFEERSPSQLATGLRGKRVLVVDDNETNRLIVRELLAVWGVLTLEAEDAEKGLLLAWDAAKRNEPFDAIVLDHQMPGMDGFEFLERLRQGTLAQRTPVIVLSSDVRGRDGARARRLGIEDYLLKPVRRMELQSALAHAISNPAVDVKRALPKSRSRLVKREHEAPTSALRILLVEDSEDNRFLIRNYLANSAHHITEACDGSEAVDLACSATEPFDLILMDMQMPVMDGYEATRRIRAYETKAGIERTRIIALTAYALNEEIQKSIDAGCDAHLTKPIKKKTLLAAIAAHTEGATSDVR